MKPEDGADPAPIAVTVESTTTEAFNALKGESLKEKIEAAVSDKVVVFGRSTCPFCIEVCRTFVEMGVPFTYWRLDQMENGAQVHEELKRMTGQRTVPYVYISQQLVGGCDATKELIASGEFDRRLGSIGGEASSDKESNPLMLKLAGADEDAPNVIGALFEFPNTVDNRVIRLVGLQVFFISLFLAIFAYKKKQAWHWVAVGLLVDFCLRFYAGAGISPLGCNAQFVTALLDLVLPMCGIKSGPVWGAGPPKQFAVSVGIMFSTIILVLQFTHQWEAATAFAATLAFFAALEAFLNFCAGCWVFGYAIKFGIVPDTIYTVHINTLPETKYTWNDWTKRVHPPEPVRYVERFAGWLRGGKATRIDLHYKTGKTDDWEREDFHPIKHVKIGFFSSVIGVAAIAAMFKFTAMIPTFSTPNLVWQVLAVISLVYTSLFLFPYLLKVFMFPRKVHKEWMHPVFSNAFSVPFMTLCVYAFLAEHYSRPLARVLFWAGAGPMMLIAVAIVGEWLSRMRHPGHINGAMQMPPVGLYIAAVVGPIVDPRYTQVCFMWFGLATIMYITLFVMTFEHQMVGHNADPRGRMFSAIWVAAPAVGSIAWTVLTNPQWKMDGFAQTLFYVALTLGFVLLWMVWRRFLWADKFFMGMWAFGFPTAGIAWAAILYDWTVDTALSKVLACCLISLACIVAFCLAMRTLSGILRLKVFVPEHRWGPMSHLPLAQESMRSMLHQANAAADALVADPSNSRLATRVATLWRTFAFVNSFYIKLKNDMCFPQIGAWFPGHQARFVAQNNRMLELQAQVDSLLEGVGKAPSGSNGALTAPTTPASLEGYAGATPAEQVAAAAAKSPLLVVGRSTCPFCIEVTRTFSEMGLSYTYLLTDKLPNGAELHASLKEATGQKTVPYVYINGSLVGGCDATKALIASGEFDRRLGGAGLAPAPGGAKKGADVAALQAAIKQAADFSIQAFDDLEDHIRPVMRRYISGPVQKKIMNDCWDLGLPEEWFQAIPLVVQHLPMLGQRLTYLRAFLWAMPERCQQIGVMVALGTDPVNWYRIRKAIPDLIPRGESGWKHF